MSRFGFGISGLYKSELTAFFFGFTFCCLLYRARYCFSYSARSARNFFSAVVFVEIVNFPRSSDSV